MEGLSPTASEAARPLRIDTHIAVWLFTGEVERLSGVAVELIEGSDVVVSPMVRLELSYLFEVGRLTIGGSDIVNDLAWRVGLVESPVPLPTAVDAAAALTWTRDPFDRLIVGDALAAGATLLTADTAIRHRVESALW